MINLVDILLFNGHKLACKQLSLSEEKFCIIHAEVLIISNTYNITQRSNCGTIKILFTFTQIKCLMQTFTFNDEVCR